jgi:hypothetical protein
MRPIDVVMLNVAHWIAGALLVFAGAMTLRNAARSAERQVHPRAAAKAMLGLGLGLIVLEIVDPMFHRATGGVSDPMWIYHSIVGGLAAIAGGAELYRFRHADAPRALAFVFPLCWVGVGVVFLVHEQASDFLLYRHWAFAITVTLVGVAKLIGELGGKPAWIKVWGILSIVAGLQFIVYWESGMAHDAAAAPHVQRQLDRRQVRPKAIAVGIENEFPIRQQTQRRRDRS